MTGQERRGYALVVAGVVAMVLAVALLAGCSHGGSRDDAPVGHIDEAPRDVWLNGDQFPNVMAFCIGGTAVFTNTRQSGDPMDVVADSAECAEGGALWHD